jgi:two-component system chemotaxis sensor kinase CheA
LSAEGEMFGLLVDEILDTADIVVKPLGSILKKIAIYSGATILGDGGVALILDVMGIAENARIDTKSQRRSEEFMDDLKSKRTEKVSDSQELLLVRLNASAVHAIPLCLVHRLEEFPLSAIEVSGGQPIVRYRDSILPVIRLNRVLGYGDGDSQQERISVVVVSKAKRSYGIAVDEVLDVVTTDRQVDDGVRDRAGIMGNLLMREEVVVVVDALDIIERELGRLAVGPGSDPAARAAIDTLRKTVAENRAQRAKILFAEDVPFFRKQVTKVLTGAGYEVIAVEDGVEALTALQASKAGEYALLLSDIEMPNKTGLELARDVRAISRFDKLPIVALTTRYRTKDVADGKSAGFDAYLEKLNSEVLLTTLRNLLANSEVIIDQETGT